MKKEEQTLQEEIDRMLGEADEIDRLEDKEYGDKSGWELPEELSTREKQLKAIRRAKAQLEREAGERREKEQAERREEAESRGKRTDLSRIQRIQNRRKATNGILRILTRGLWSTATKHSSKDITHSPPWIRRHISS